MTNNLNQLTAKDIKRIRNKHNLTQAEFAEKLEVGELTVSRWENNERTCKGKYAEKVKELDIDWSDKNTNINGKLSVTIDFNEIETKLRTSEGIELKENQHIIFKEIQIIGNVNNLYL